MPQQALVSRKQFHYNWDKLTQPMKLFSTNWRIWNCLGVFLLMANLCFRERVVFSGQSSVDVFWWVVFHSPELRCGADRRRLFHISHFQLYCLRSSQPKRDFSSLLTQLDSLMTCLLGCQWPGMQTSTSISINQKYWVSWKSAFFYAKPI